MVKRVDVGMSFNYCPPFFLIVMEGIEVNGFLRSQVRSCMQTVCGKSAFTNLANILSMQTLGVNMLQKLNATCGFSTSNGRHNIIFKAMKLHFCYVGLYDQVSTSLKTQKSVIPRLLNREQPSMAFTRLLASFLIGS